MPRPIPSWRGALPGWRPLAFAAFFLLNGCSHSNPAAEQTRVARAFEDWQNAVIHDRLNEAMTYIPRHVDDYLRQLNTAPLAPTTPAGGSPSTAGSSPDVDLLLRKALEKKVPPDLRARLTLATLLQRITDRHLFNPRDVREIALGQVSVNGDHAAAVVYYQGTLTALRLPFLKEDNRWKIDVMSLLPYAEVLMHVDRAMKGETETQQVDQLVAKLPSL